jgi:hypothetical protein
MVLEHRGQFSTSDEISLRVCKRRELIRWDGIIIENFFIELLKCL